MRERHGRLRDELLNGEVFNTLQARKILIENYNDCQHCPNVHPELVQVVPTYKKGETGYRNRPDGGVALITGGKS